jgi:hypothetical protein
VQQQQQLQQQQQQQQQQQHKPHEAQRSQFDKYMEDQLAATGANFPQLPVGSHS